MAVKPEETFTLAEHLGELRKRLVVSLVAIVVGIIIAAVFSGRLFDLLLFPLQQVPGLAPDSYKIITLSPTEPFMISLKVWVVASLIATSPLLIWQFWAFVGPAFTSTEKRYFYPVVIATTVLFLGGTVFGYLLVLPKGMSFLLTFGGGRFNIQNRASEYFPFVAFFLLAFGAIFETPVVLVMLAKLGIIDDRFLRRNRRYAIVISAFAAALLTPGQDVFSMIAMLIPLVLLYEISIPIARWVQPRPEPEARPGPAAT